MDKQLIKDLIYGLTLVSEVIGSFMIAVIVGIQLDRYFHTKPVWIIILLILAFIHVMKILFKVGKK